MKTAKLSKELLDALVSAQKAAKEHGPISGTFGIVIKERTYNRTGPTTCRYQSI